MKTAYYLIPGTHCTGSDLVNDYYICFTRLDMRTNFCKRNARRIITELQAEEIKALAVQLGGVCKEYGRHCFPLNSIDRKTHICLPNGKMMYVFAKMVAPYLA